MSRASPPRMLAGQAEGAAPLVTGRPVASPQTVATAIRIGNPARLEEATAAVRESNGAVRAMPDDRILSAYRLLAQEEGVFCEPASATSVAALIEAVRRRARRAGLDGRLRPHRPRAQGSRHRRRRGRRDRPLPARRREPRGAGAGRGARPCLSGCTSRRRPRPRTWGRASTAWGRARAAKRGDDRPGRRRRRRGDDRGRGRPHGASRRRQPLRARLSSPPAPMPVGPALRDAKPHPVLPRPGVERGDDLGRRRRGPGVDGPGRRIRSRRPSSSRATPTTWRRRSSVG